MLLLAGLNVNSPFQRLVQELQLVCPKLFDRGKAGVLASLGAHSPGADGRGAGAGGSSPSHGSSSVLRVLPQELWGTLL